ncbi:GntR family transcriptional regulator [Euzebya tangerina]|uniref:GntR family transcriptional regulator n=1 Tax=Euzebya tangerina TaxID=591198 RepID=UPI0013C36457|nr:GntR family transcriptional regulator [Euzebya tangerina]
MSAPPTLGDLDRESPVPLYVQIERRLHGMIAAGQLGTGARVPSEIDLSESFGVSRMTARKALDQLVATGMLFRKQGKGTFVSTRRIGHGLSTKLSFSAAMDALGFSHETTVLRAGIVDAPTHVAAVLDLPGSATVVEVKRVRHVEGEAVALHDTYVVSSYAAILDHDLTGSLTQAMTEVGAAVVTAKDTVSATLAGHAVARHLGVAEGAPILQIVGVGYADSAKPLRYTEAQYRGDRFTFDLDAGPPSELGFDIAVKTIGDLR